MTASHAAGRAAGPACPGRRRPQERAPMWVRPRRSRGGLEERMQAEVVFTELATVVSRRDLDDAGEARALDADAQRFLDCGTSEAVHHDLEHRVDALRQSTL